MNVAQLKQADAACVEAYRLRFHIHMNVAQLKPVVALRCGRGCGGFHIHMNVAQLKLAQPQRLRPFTHVSTFI